MVEIRSELEFPTNGKGPRELLTTVNSDDIRFATVLGVTPDLEGDPTIVLMLGDPHDEDPEIRNAELFALHPGMVYRMVKMLAIGCDKHPALRTAFYLGFVEATTGMNFVEE